MGTKHPKRWYKDFSQFLRKIGVNAKYGNEKNVMPVNLILTFLTFLRLFKEIVSNN